MTAPARTLFPREEQRRELTAQAVAALARQAIRRVIVLSPVSLGADVAITSVFLDGLLRAVPQAGLVFVGLATSRAIVVGQTGVECRR